MKIILYPLYAVASWAMAICAYLFAPVIALFVDSSGNLPSLLKWFQTPDAPCYGAPFWAQRNPAYSRYKLCVTWLWRNPAQGFDQFTNSDVTYQTPVKSYGNLNINDQVAGAGGWFLIVGGGVFQFSAVMPIGFGRILDTGIGWRLDPIAKGYKTPTLGALMATPLRYHVQ